MIRSQSFHVCANTESSAGRTYSSRSNVGTTIDTQGRGSGAVSELGCTRSVLGEVDRAVKGGGAVLAFGTSASAMLSPANIRANALVKLGELTGKTHALPLVLFSPTARCNSRCVSCDWWRADGAGDLSLDEIAALAAELPRFGTRVVVFTGGEPLVRADVMAAADLFRARGITLQLLTSGLALGRHAAEIAARFQTVTVSLDGHTPDLYREIRGVDGLGAVVDGVRKLRALAPHVGVW